MRRARVVLVLFVLLAGGLAACTPPGPGPAPGLRVETALDGLSNPWDLAFTPDGTLLFTERVGTVNAVVGGQRRVLAAPPDVVAASEAGMMGLAVTPRFDRNRRIVTCFAAVLPGGGQDVRVVRWKVNRDYTALVNRRDIVTGLPVNTRGELGRHSGCRPRFGPDGHLWVGTGDAAEGTVPQDPASLGGKVLRIRADGTPAPGNPGGALDPRIYTYGHRNVQGLAFRPGTGAAYSVEHGPDRDDEVNRLGRGRNYGWDPVPGYDESVPMTDTGKFPGARAAVWSSGSPPIAPGGATFLTGGRWGSWNGALVLAALRGTQLRVLFLGRRGRLVGQTTALPDQGRLRTPLQGPDGNLYLTVDARDGAGRILRVSPG